VNVNVEFKVTLHEQIQGHLTVLKVTVCHTAGHYGGEEVKAGSFIPEMLFP